MTSTRTAHARRLFDGIASRYDRPAEVLGLGQYHRWRREMAAGLELEPGSLVLDVATGTGLVAKEILGRFDARVVGLDQSAEMIRVARTRSVDGLKLVRGDGQRLPFGDAAFDAVAFSYLLRYVDDPGATLEELARVLKPGGQMASIEFGLPPNAVARAAWRVYAYALFPAAARVLSPGWKQVGGFLGRSITEFGRAYPPERLEQLWEKAGMRDVRTKRMSLGGGVVTSGRRA